VAARHAVEVQVLRLRKALGADSVLLTRAPGHLLHGEPGELVLHRFEGCWPWPASTRAGGRGRAARVLRDGEGLWRGRPLADLESNLASRAAGRTRV
jgi:hypothetical protein